MMTASVKGKTQQEAETLIQEFRDMATGQLDTGKQAHHLGRLTVFAGVRDLPTRVKCAILPWHTLHAALHCGRGHFDRIRKRSDARADRRRLRSRSIPPCRK